MNKEILTDIENAVEVLTQGGIILYPTDTIWGIGCDATNEDAVKKIFDIKKRETNKSLIVLIDKIRNVRNYVTVIPPVTYEIMKNNTRPTTIIYPVAKNLAANVIADDGSIAIRIPHDKFCQKLLKTFAKPLVSTSANFSGETSAVSFDKISKDLIKQMDYVVRYNQTQTMNVQASRIIKVNLNNSIIIIRD
ncbi:MAG: L-threonylcarbamoyladenylate synthase [Bacteroidetes bacterium]|nr:L-threonylcarbamoyladenylate synthase [Bacteroidota bacterium]